MLKERGQGAEADRHVRDGGISTANAILIKIASTWEGIRAAERLEQRGHPLQPDASVQLRPGRGLRRGKVTLISPFVGRIYDWHKKEPARGHTRRRRPGVISVTRIYNYYKKFGYKTEIMGASFRNVDQIVRLAGWDLLTISPDLLEQMERTQGEVPRRLSVESAKSRLARRNSPG